MVIAYLCIFNMLNVCTGWDITHWIFCFQPVSIFPYESISTHSKLHTHLSCRLVRNWRMVIIALKKSLNSSYMKIFITFFNSLQFIWIPDWTDLIHYCNQLTFFFTNFLMVHVHCSLTEVPQWLQLGQWKKYYKEFCYLI